LIDALIEKVNKDVAAMSIELPPTYLILKGKDSFAHFSGKVGEPYSLFRPPTPMLVALEEMLWNSFMVLFGLVKKPSFW